MANQCVTGVIYFLIFAHIVGGLTRIIKSNSRNSYWNDHPQDDEDLTENIAAGVVSMILGLILLLGVVKRNHQIVFAYFCVTTALLTIGAVLLVPILILYATDALVIGICLTVLGIATAFQYCVYLFYASLKKTSSHLREPENLPHENGNLYSVSEDLDKTVSLPRK